MAYQVSWIVQNRVLYIKLSGDITLEDFHSSTRQIADYMEDAYSSDSSGMIIGIVDLRASGFGQLMRSILSTLAQEIAAVIDSRLWKAKPGFIILITTSDAAKLLTSMIIRLSTQPMTTVGTLAEALTVVSYMYPELQSQLDIYQESQQSAENIG